LLKSTACGEEPTIESLQAEGKLDGEFGNFREERLRVNWINLRDEKFPTTRLVG
ncbi:MAG: hypothetical protein HUJ26_20385, partial [Planctomycetaceae bacterium]|nr:hypothetical protein [Planctomycetaceae bacterium]